MARVLKVPVSQSIKLRGAMDVTFLIFMFVMSEFNFYFELFPISPPPPGRTFELGN